MTEEAPPVPKPYITGVFIPTFYALFIMCLSSLLFRANFWVWQVFQTNSTLQVAPLGTSTGGQIGFSAIYLAIAIVFTFGMVALLKRKKIKPKTWIVMACMLAFVTFSFAVVDFQNLSIPEIFLLVMVFWVVYVLSIRGVLPRFTSLPFITLMSVVTGTAIAISFPVLTVIMLPVLFSVWDLYAVWKGPMLKMAMGVPTKMQQTMLAQLGASKLGFGDLLMYSILAAIGTSYGILNGSIMIGFIAIGVYVTFMILRTGKYKGLPGLPLPVLLGLVGLGLSFLV